MSTEKRVTRHGSQQREAIYEYVASEQSHPTADQVFAGVRRTWPTLGLATVYRNLAALVSEGRLSCSVHEGVTRYDAETGLHHHFTCRSCGNVQNIELDLPSEVLRRARRKVAGKVEAVSLDLQGVCPSCV
jgi:Fur family transcriptional regulator, peroxide stress response regulator